MALMLWLDRVYFDDDDNGSKAASKWPCLPCLERNGCNTVTWCEQLRVHELVECA
jgi:hypothetical protein